VGQLKKSGFVGRSCWHGRCSKEKGSAPAWGCPRIQSSLGLPGKPTEQWPKRAGIISFQKDRLPMRPQLTSVKSTARGVSGVDLLIVIAMAAVIAGFAVFSLVRANRTTNRSNYAVDIANHLQKARQDSIRRKPTELNQMAQLKVFNRRFYSIAVDADSDGYLDVPLVISLPESTGVEIGGPFPKTYIFDSEGQTVDEKLRRVVPAAIKVGNSSGASNITFSDDGKITVAPANNPASN